MLFYVVCFLIFQFLSHNLWPFSFEPFNSVPLFLYFCVGGCKKKDKLNPELKPRLYFFFPKRNQIYMQIFFNIVVITNRFTSHSIYRIGVIVVTIEILQDSRIEDGRSNSMECGCPTYMNGQGIDLIEGR